MSVGDNEGAVVVASEGATLIFQRLLRLRPQEVIFAQNSIRREVGRGSPADSAVGFV